MLSSGDVLDGKRAYEMIMPYFTTTELKPDEVYKLGYEQLQKLYPQVRVMFSLQRKQKHFRLP